MNELNPGMDFQRRRPTKTKTKTKTPLKIKRLAPSPPHRTKTAPHKTVRLWLGLAGTPYISGRRLVVVVVDL